jgi:hypothetical protein
MWVELTDDEVEKKRKKKARNSGWLVVIIVLAITVIRDVYGINKPTIKKKPLELHEIIEKIPIYLIIGGASFFLGYKLRRLRNEPIVMLCLSCEKNYKNPFITNCECGGQVRNLEACKFVEQANKHDENISP